MAVLMAWRNKTEVQACYRCSQQLIQQDSSGEKTEPNILSTMSSRNICQCQSCMYKFKTA